MTDVLDTISSASQNALETVVNGGSNALDAIRRPAQTRRRGAQATERALKQANGVIDDTLALPERALVAYLRGLRKQARRKDVVGIVSRNVLIAVNRPAGGAASFFSRVEKETAVSARPAGRSTAAATSKTKRAVRRTARKTTAAAKTTRRRVAAKAVNGRRRPA